MTIFKSRQVNLDPEPWITFDGIRVAADIMGTKYDPRPEFEPTRDPLPYWDTETDDDDPIRLSFKVDDPTNSVVWKPRREQFDTPVNPILVAFRRHGAGFFGGIDGWLKYAMHGTHADEMPITPEHIDHARKVLSRLAALA